MRMDVADEELATAAAVGDREAFTALLSRHYNRVFRLAFRLTGQRVEAEDLTQDVCVALPAKLKGWRGDAKFTTWIYRVTVNAAHDRRRRRASHDKAAAGWGEQEIARHADTRAANAARDWLVEAMTRLPPDLRDTVALTLEDEMSHAEAAAVLGVSEGTVSWRMSEVRKRLRAIAEEEEKT